MSTLPKRCTALRKHAATAVGLVTSVATESALAPAARAWLATLASAAARRATSTTLAPAAAKASAVSRPMPLEAPVTRTVLPSKRRAGSFMTEA